MIDQVGNISYKESPFYNFSQSGRVKNFYVEKKYIPKEDKSNNHKVIVTLATSALALGFGILAIMGAPKGTSKLLNKIKNILEKKIAQTKASKAGENVNQFYLSSLNKVNSIIEKSESINNFTSIKDALCKKLMEKRQWSRKIYEKITKLFEKTSRETVVASWQNTKHKMHKTFTSMEKIDKEILATKGEKAITINGITKKGKEWLEIIKNNRQNITEILETNTSKGKSIARYKKIKTATEHLDDVTIEIFKDWKNRNLYQTFAADRVILKDKAELFDELMSFRKQISYTREDKLNLVKGIIKKIENYTATSDYSILQQFNKLKSDLNLKAGIDDKTLLRELEDLQKALKDGKVKVDAENHVFEMLAKSQKIITGKDNAYGEIAARMPEGKLDEILKIYKALIPEKYSKIEKMATNATKAIDNSINIESEQFFDKVRDLQIGSAPTDALSILGSAAMIGVGLAKAKDNDERVSVTLKAGIPVLGAVATSLYCTARLISGGKAMAVGLLSGYVLNKIGEKTDDIRKKYITFKPESNANAL